MIRKKSSQFLVGTKELTTGQHLLVLKAAWVLPVSREPIANACILIAGNKIENIVSEKELDRHIAGREHVMRDYGQAIIVPGLINLHTHLEHTYLHPLATDAGLLEWLPKLMQATAHWSFEDRGYSAIAGIKEALGAGTTFIVDNSYNGASVKGLAKSGARSLVGLEIFGVDESSAEEQWQLWLERLSALLEDEDICKANNEGLITLTVAPHSPYTACPAIWKKAYQWAKEKKHIFITHLAESQAEYNWFRSNDKNLKQFIINAFSKRYPNFASLYEKQMSWKNGSQSSIDHLHKHGLLANNLLAAHAVHINDQDIDLLKANNVAIAHCPRSNAKLRCGRAPMNKIQASGLKFGLGTDGLGSNDDLDLLAEGRFAIELHRSFEPDLKLGAKEILECLTIKAAQCLNLEHQLGSLDAGKLADLAVFAPEISAYASINQYEQNPYDLLVYGKRELKALFVNGKEIGIA